MHFFLECLILKTLPRLDLPSIIPSLDSCTQIIPPNPIKKFIYKCDRRFYVDDIIKLYETYDDYAIVLASGKQTLLYTYNENNTTLVKSISETIPNQHKTGGQSAVRFSRIRDEIIGWYVKKIITEMVKHYTKDGIFYLKGLIIAGPAEIKKMISDDDTYTKIFSKNLLKIMTIDEINDQSITKVINSSRDVFKIDDTIKSIENLISNPSTIDLVVFGNGDVSKLLELGQLKELYIYQDYYDTIDFTKINDKTKIIKFGNQSMYKKYGQMIGVKYYSNDTNYDD